MSLGFLQHRPVRPVLGDKAHTLPASVAQEECGAANSSQYCFCAGERPLDDSKRLCAHLLEKAVDELDNGGETILGIF